MKKKQYLVTSKGLQKLKDELVEKEKKLKKTKLLVGEMIEAGDLSENDGYNLAIEDSVSLEGEILELREKLENATVVKGKVKGKIEIGDSIKIEAGNGKTMQFALVGENEANPLENKISYESPMGKALIGKKEKDTFEFTTPKGNVKYKILKIFD